jgi:hypothetical protein
MEDRRLRRVRLHQPRTGPTLAKAILYSQEYESELVTYKASFDHMAVDGDGPTGIAPGDIVLIADFTRGNAIAGGRVEVVNSATTFTILGDPVTAGTGTVYLEHAATGTVEYVTCTYTGNIVTLTGTPTEPVIENDLYIVIAGGFDAETFRIVKIAQSEQNLFEITAVRYNEGKFNAIYDEHQYTDANVMRIDRGAVTTKPGPVTATPSMVVGPDRQHRTIEIRWLSRKLGTELVTNGTFDTVTTGWAASGVGASISVVGAALRVTGTGTIYATAIQTLPNLTPDKTYQYSFDTKGGTAGMLFQIWDSGSMLLQVQNSAAPKTWEGQFTVPTGSVGPYTIQAIVDGTTGYVDYDNISLKEYADADPLFSHFRVRYSYLNDAWADLSPVAGTATRIDDVKAGSYRIRVQAVNRRGVESEAVETTATVTAVPSTTELPLGTISNLTLHYHGKDVKVGWNTITPRKAYLDLKGITNINTGVPDPSFRDCLVTVKKTSDGSVLRADPVTGNTYTYTYENNLIDSGGTGVATRQLTFEVTYRDIYGRAASPTTLAADNTAPPAPTSRTVTAAPLANLLSWVNAPDSDLYAVNIYASIVNSVGTATLVGTENGTLFLHTGLTSGVTWYYWVTSIDLWGNESAKTSAGSATVGSVTSFDAALLGIGDDNIFTSKEKSQVLIPQAADLEARYVDLAARGSAAGVSTTAATTARTNWKNQLAVYSPAWNDRTQSTTIFIQWFPDRLFPTNWTLTTVTTGANGAYTTITDSSGAAAGDIARSQTQAAAATQYSASVVIDKSSTVTRFPRFELRSTGGTGKTAGFNINTSTGAASGSANMDAFGVLDLGDEWFVWGTFTTTATDTSVTFRIYPAFTNAIANTTSNVATTGNIDARDPTIAAWRCKQAWNRLSDRSLQCVYRRVDHPCRKYQHQRRSIGGCAGCRFGSDHR